MKHPVPMHLWLVPQTRPHPPQFLRSVSVFASQPSAMSPLQSAKNPMHTSPHLDASHRGASPVGAARHAAPHAPQFAALVERSVSQPFVASPSQSPKPAAQVNPHAPAVQVAAAARAEHDYQNRTGTLEERTMVGGPAVTTAGRVSVTVVGDTRYGKCIEEGTSRIRPRRFLASAAERCESAIVGELSEAMARAAERASR